MLGWLLMLGLVSVHLGAGRLRRLDRWRHRQWRSFAGGVAIAYIFLEVLPELAVAQTKVDRLEMAAIAWVEQHIYLLALTGLMLFYGLESAALQAKRSRATSSGQTDPLSRLFWIHISAFAANTAFLGYLFHEQTIHDLFGSLFLFGALALHFFVVDHGLREHHPHAYDRVGRWLLAGSVILGWGVSQSLPESDVAVSMIWAFVSGAILLNVLKEELPEQSQGCFRAFCCGAGLYLTLWLLV